MILNTCQEYLESDLRHKGMRIVLRCCCCWYWPPIHEGFPNYEVVVFQPRTFPPPHSVAYDYSLIYPLPHRFLFLFYGSLFSLSFLTPPHTQPLLFEALLISTCSQHTFLVQSAAHLDVACRSPASSACPFAPRRVPVSADVPVPIRFPLFRPWYAPRSLSDSGGFDRRRSLCVTVSLTHHTQVLLQMLASSGFGVLVGWIFAKIWALKVPPLPVSRVHCYFPPGTWTCWSCSGYLALPSPFPPLPPSLFSMILPPLVEEVWVLLL